MQKKSFENFSGSRWWYFKLSCQFVWLNIEKMEINVKEQNLKEQFKETTERMIKQNNMEVIPKRLVDNVIKNAVEELKNEKTSEKK